ncbi:hypothetical protein [Acinetobacter baumannii]|uniref:hypothetical protein n=1 Tax=Acinetobacter baumannii TaxID=470 RepID=UPI001EEFEFAA|nr:hypothetical protein [Acinetobacter baumannii]MCG6644492.1 hypothetical protein [Acinetobacter baumannii]MCG6644535.1 hypothetical protein [Acinetobacter baumannii]
MFDLIISNLHIIGDGSVEVGIEGENGSIKSTEMEISGFPIAYKLESCQFVDIQRNQINLPIPLNETQLIRAVLANNCKTLLIRGNNVIFQSQLDFEKIKSMRMVTFGKIH